MMRGGTGLRLCTVRFVCLIMSRLTAMFAFDKSTFSMEEPPLRLDGATALIRYMLPLSRQFIQRRAMKIIAQRWCNAPQRRMHMTIS
ncbi:MAG: hypothetical protein ACLT16_11635 [[Clostridium] innocuum]